MQPILQSGFFLLVSLSLSVCDSQSAKLKSDILVDEADVAPGGQIVAPRLGPDVALGMPAPAFAPSPVSTFSPSSRSLNDSSGDSCECWQFYCANDSDCDDNNACTSDRCLDAKCVSAPLSGCAVCDTITDCNNNNDLCPTNVCIENRCVFNRNLRCLCTNDNDCADANVCTVNSCTEGHCIQSPILGCAACSVDEDCNDNNACTNDICLAQQCVSLPVFGCAVCTLNSDCVGGPTCTTATCANSICTYPVDSDCTLERGI